MVKKFCQKIFVKICVLKLTDFLGPKGTNVPILGTSQLNGCEQ